MWPSSSGNIQLLNGAVCWVLSASAYKSCKLDFCLYCNRGIKIILTSETDIYVQTAFYYTHFTLLYRGRRAFEIIITNILTSGISVLTQLCC